MSEQPPSKGLKPVENAKMLNFIYWLATNHPNIRNIQSLEEAELLRLAKTFEQDRQDLESDTTASWRESIYQMFQGNNNYKAAMKVLERKK